MKLYRGKISAVSDGEEAPEGFVKVTLPGVNASAESEWTECPGFSSGDGFGLFIPPTVGVRVAVAFAEDDDLQEDPIILRVIWDETLKAPAGGKKLVRLRLPADQEFEVQIGDLVMRQSGNKLEIQSGNGASKKVAVAEKTEARLNALENAFNSHTHTTAVGILGAFPTVSITPTATSTAANATATELITVKE